MLDYIQNLQKFLFSMNKKYIRPIAVYMHIFVRIAGRLFRDWTGINQKIIQEFVLEEVSPKDIA